METVRLKVCGFEGPTRWVWELRAQDGVLLAAYGVSLDAKAWQYEAVSDLYGYVRLHAAPDRWSAEEARITHLVGRWLTDQVLGPVAVALAGLAPVVVEVIIPEAAEVVTLYPLSAAVVDRRALAEFGVVPVLVVGERQARQIVRSTQGRVRVLSLFSVPPRASAMHLRKERESLSELAGRTDTRMDLTVVQYGATRERLRQVVQESAGWDIVHLSGHGEPGALLLEHPDGTPDLIDSSDLVEILSPLAGRVSVVTVSVCSSASPSLAERSRLLGLDGAGAVGPPAPAIGLRIAGELDCAVLAMRFPVSVEFATALAVEVYGCVIRGGASLPEAVATALPPLVDGAPTSETPPLSHAAPVVFGRQAIAMRLPVGEPASPGTPQGAESLAGLPRPPVRMVGRVGILTRIGSALAADSGIAGVVLHGMAGGGKTTCALEAAYVHRDAFEIVVWFTCPEEGRSASDTLAAFAAALESRAPDLRFAHLLDDDVSLTDFLPRLTAWARRRRSLTILDNAESLLAADGRWADPRWRHVIDALVAHDGPSRVLMTSRVPIADLGARVRTEVVDALPPDEALLLARELPRLRALLSGRADDTDPAKGRELVARVLEESRGHPKLVELADGQASDVKMLIAMLDARRPLGPEAPFAQVLHTWTQTAVSSLPQPASLLLAYLCALEEDHRTSAVVDATWHAIWKRLGVSEPAPAARGLTAILAERALVTVVHDTQRQAEEYRVHPAVSASVRSLLDPAAVVDDELADYWCAEHQRALGNGKEIERTRDVVAAVAGALPYLLRQESWERAVTLLSSLPGRDFSRAAAARILPITAALVQATDGTPIHPSAEFVLGWVKRRTDPCEGERLLRELLADAALKRRYTDAVKISSELVILYRESGRIDAAVALAKQGIEFARRANAGPWTVLACEATRLVLAALRGEEFDILRESSELLAAADRITGNPGRPEAVEPWEARELLYDAGALAARRLGSWSRMLEYAAANAESKARRRAPEPEIARARYNTYGALLELGRAREAVEMLRECRSVFEHHQDSRMLSMMLSALAEAELELGHGELALHLGREALRWKYRVGDPEPIALGHHNLGQDLRRHGALPLACAHHLAAAVIRAVTGHAYFDGSLTALAADAVASPVPLHLPHETAELYHVVNQIDGVRLDLLLEELACDESRAQRTIDEVLAAVPDRVAWLRKR